MNVDPKRFEEIEQVIHSDSSPVGIDAKKTHILIISMLEELTERLAVAEGKVDRLLQGSSRD